ncbi:Diaminopropionate ammonia-lyase [Lachnellula subtilissima]|uniref:Diaminopropionate ammonia-lyase n=1 Tax=Lachnellula subtilissima TaxID=602034 RepID=A0A8H8RUT1_9HELO|nr:Diaminopropionate ammonia-lyase [Lachnellula subtilissima]
MSPKMFINMKQSSPMALPAPNPKVGAFHRILPHYGYTPLVSLPEIAKELGIGHLLLKDEGSRLGLPAFKILGASWATVQVISKIVKLGSPEPTKGALSSTSGLSLEHIAKAAQEADFTLYAATDGSHGRAVSRMAKYLGIRARILVPKFVDRHVIANIQSEGSTVEVYNGDYDQAVLAAKRAAEEHPDGKGLLISDTPLDFGDETAHWIVDGYQTIFDEIEEQVVGISSGKAIIHVIIPVGSGSLATAAAIFFSRKLVKPIIITVEPEAAPCLKASLEAGKSTTVDVGYSICTGMCCGTLSANAWPILKECVNIALTVDDLKVDEAIVDLRRYGVRSGPCGAASLSAARQLLGTESFDSKSIVLVLCTEGARSYELKI